MTRRDKLYDDYENALFALLMEDVAEAQGRQALAENEQLQADPAAAMPEALHERCVRTVRRKLAAGRRSAAGKTAFRLVSRVAVVVMLLVLTMTVAFAASPAVKSSVVRWAVDHYADHTDFTIPDYGSSTSVQSGLIDEDGVWIGASMEISVGWIPEGLELTQEGSDSQARWLIFQDDGRRLFLLLDYLGTGKLALDTENAQQSFISLHGNAALLYANDRDLYYTIFLPLPALDGYLIIATEGLSEEEFLHIAESIELKQ